MEFTEYASRFSNEAIESRKSMPADAVKLLDEILDELTQEPDRYPERIIPASREGTSFVYMHPDPVIQITYEVDREQKVIYFFHFSAPALQVRNAIFVSYSHKDKPWLNKIRSFLSVLEQQGLIKLWDDEQLEAGTEWKAQIEEALDAANAGVLLVSQDFLSSKFVNETELPALLDGAAKKGKKIFWVSLSPSTVFETHSDITRFQSLMEDPQTSLDELSSVQQKKALVQISKKLSEVVGAP